MVSPGSSGGAGSSATIAFWNVRWVMGGWVGWVGGRVGGWGGWEEHLLIQYIRAHTCNRYEVNDRLKKGKKRVLLDDISGVVRPGQVGGWVGWVGVGWGGWVGGWVWVGLGWVGRMGGKNAFIPSHLIGRLFSTLGAGCNGSEWVWEDLHSRDTRGEELTNWRG